MLEQLFGSKTRVKLLGLFLHNPQQHYYLRQLARELKAQLNSVRREIKNLESLGIIMLVKHLDDELEQDSTGKKKKPRKGLEKFYIINSNFVLYQELRTLFIKAQFLLEKRFIEMIKKTGKFKFFILTGYFVGMDGFSTDMLLVGSIKRKKLASMIKKFEKELNHEINYTLMSQSEFKYRKDITDRFLYNILENKKIVVVNDFKE